jgi:hypothetical protein
MSVLLVRINSTRSLVLILANDLHARYEEKFVLAHLVSSAYDGRIGWAESRHDRPVSEPPAMRLIVDTIADQLANGASGWRMVHGKDLDFRVSPLTCLSDREALGLLVNPRLELPREVMFGHLIQFSARSC